MRKTCPICKKQFEVKRKDRYETQITCSARCRNTHTSRKTAAKRSKTLRGKGDGKAYKKHMGRHKHRVVMEKILDRPLRPGEVVHHKDGNHLNNSPDNLVLLKSQAEHARVHFTKNKICIVPGCVRKSRALDMCSMHYQRWKRTGTTDLRRASSE